MSGGMAQALKGLLCKHESLSSNPSPTEKKKKSNIVEMIHPDLYLFCSILRYCVDAGVAQNVINFLLHFPMETIGEMCDFKISCVILIDQKSCYFS
jgi:hypothetical protein